MDHPHHPLDTRLPALLKSGQRLRGLFNSLPSPAIVEMCGYAGFDFVILDNEHGSANLETTEHMLRAARASGIVPVVRCLRHDISRVLDMGASGVQIPMVGSAEEARDLVQQVRYPRVGRRGSAFSPRAAGYGAFPGVAHTERSNAGVALIVMIETPKPSSRPPRSRRCPAWTPSSSGPTTCRTPWASTTTGRRPRWRPRSSARCAPYATRATAAA
jgi:4-hydroxy-2-oxoheptanedioate aldolase